ncbi:MAG TPA: MerR family transcriptional regulator [Vitreimonas sp.]|nr:MerR family transcriptional regulator [Vitreimonas sp.]
MKHLTVSQLGKAIGVTPKTIRFYESEGLITPTKRAENGYRLYDESLVEELQLIKQARDLGLPLKEIKTLLAGCQGESCDHTKKYVQGEIDDYLVKLSAKIDQLLNLQAKLQQLRTQLDSNPQFCEGGKYCCNILHQLSKV